MFSFYFSVNPTASKIVNPDKSVAQILIGLNYRIEELDEFAEKEDLEAMKHLKSGKTTLFETLINITMENVK